jgi:hypothetical protein
MNRPTQNVNALNLLRRCEKRGFKNRLEGDLRGAEMMRKTLFV